ncbi:MAG: hypothetical protein LBQ92_03195, partial [Propionibacteriaceae bacterium]|nr:hypothetical protein [Propionibacteriaceae bacterium]
LPDIDLDVESARRLEVYDIIWGAFGADRVACVAMVETYRVRHAIRDAGQALSLPPGEIDVLAKAFPHISARHARKALAELPEFRRSGISPARFDALLALVESLDALPRHLAMHPCGVILSDSTLAARTPLQPSGEGYLMSQFDKDDVEELGFLKLDVLGVRMQSALAHAGAEIQRVTGASADIDSLAPFDDPRVYDMIGSSDTVGCFQIESPGQRELLGKFGPRDFADIIIDISLFRPGPVKADMVVPFLNARLGWKPPEYPHPRLRPILEQSCGVVVFHEQIIQIVAAVTGCSLAEGEQARRSLGKPGSPQLAATREWFHAAGQANGFPAPALERLWGTLESFAAFGFCKAHAAAFALPTYQSAWLKRYWPAFFYAGALTHDPGMYPKRLLLHAARRAGAGILGVDVNRSAAVYQVEESENGGQPQYAIRVALADIDGISAAEIGRIAAGRPFSSLTDFHKRAQVSAPVLEKLVRVGAFDSLYGITPAGRLEAAGGPGSLTRRDLLLAAQDLIRLGQASRQMGAAQQELEWAAACDIQPTGLPELTAAEVVRSELEILGMDVSRHVLQGRLAALAERGVVFAKDLLAAGDDPARRKDVLVAGVKVATQTPPVRSGKRVVFLTLDDSTGLSDATFFHNAQERCAATVFQSWQLVVRGEIRRTGAKGVSVRAEDCWDLDEFLADGPRPAATAPRKLWHSSTGSAGW